jgi:hypothetical protein
LGDAGVSSALHSLGQNNQVWRGLVWHFKLEFKTTSHFKRQIYGKKLVLHLNKYGTLIRGPKCVEVVVFDVHIAVMLKRPFFCDVTLCHWASILQRFVGSSAFLFRSQHSDRNKKN